MLELNTQVEISRNHQQAQQESKPSIQALTYSLVTNARVLKKHGEYQLAMNLLRQASGIETHELVLEELTDILIKLEKWKEAYRVCQQWTKRATHFLSVYSLAQIEYQLGLDDKSLQSYFELLSLVEDSRPELFEVFKNMGNIFVRKSDFESAEEFYNKAYAIKSHSDILLVNYGVLEMQRGDLNKARDRFRSAVQLNSMNDKAWVGLAMVHFDFSDFDLGVANLKKALDIAPGNKTALNFAIQKMIQPEHQAFLIEAMQNYLSVDEFDEDVSCQLIQKFFQAGRIDLALLETQRLIVWHPEKIEYFNMFEKLQIAQERTV